MVCDPTHPLPKLHIIRKLTTSQQQSRYKAPRGDWHHARYVLPREEALIEDCGSDGDGLRSDAKDAAGLGGQQEIARVVGAEVGDDEEEAAAGQGGFSLMKFLRISYSFTTKRRRRREVRHRYVSLRFIDFSLFVIASITITQTLPLSERRKGQSRLSAILILSVARCIVRRGDRFRFRFPSFGSGRKVN